MNRFELLREALPYIQKFKGKVFVVKLGGQITEERSVLLSLAEEIALLDQVGFRVVVVHGGGRQLSRLAERLGIPQRLVEGRRVTDAETLEVAKMVFAGKIRTDILSVFRRMGVPTVGLSGLDGNIVRARRRAVQRVVDRETGQESMVDFGHVGDIVEIDGRLLELLLQSGYVPVVSSLGADSEGNVYNINADTVAAEIAIHLKAEKLILAGAVDGVYLHGDDPASKISFLTLAQAKELIDSGDVSAGMIPKLSAVVSLLSRGVCAAHLINGLRRNTLLQEVFTDQGTGTMIARDADSDRSPQAQNTR